MKYVLVHTQYHADSKAVEEKFIAKDAEHFCFETRKLSEAMVWDNFDDIADYVEENKIDDCKIVMIDDKVYFKAMLAGY